MDTIATVQDHLTALMLDACFDLGRLGLDPDDPRSAVALGRLVAFSSQLGDEVDRTQLTTLTARLTVLAGVLREIEQEAALLNTSYDMNEAAQRCVTRILTVARATLEAK